MWDIGFKDTTTTTSPPTSPGVPTFSAITASSAIAVWTAASSPVGIAGYETSVNGGAYVSVGTSLTQNLSGLTPATLQTFAVRAYDINGIRGASSTATFTTLSLPIVATPTIAPASGSSGIGQLLVTMADTTPGAQINWTGDGSTPSPTHGTGYGTPFYDAALGITNFQAIAYAPGYANSAIASATYMVYAGTVATPTFGLAPGTYSGAQSVSISDTTPGASIYFTTDGTTPTFPITGSTQIYSGPITVSASETIKAIGALTNYATSAVSTAAYTISSGAFPTSRNKYQWPGGSASDGTQTACLPGCGSIPSLWNQSIGSGATWHNPNLSPATWIPMGVVVDGNIQEEDYLLLDTTQPQVNVNLQTNPLQWGTGFSLCSQTSTVIGTCFIPPQFYGGDLGDSTGSYKRNNGAVLIKSDGDTLWNTQQFYVCSPSTPGTGAAPEGYSGGGASAGLFDVSYRSGSLPSNLSIKGDLRFGAHGGSHLSALGGTLRKWEVAAKGPIYHALRIMQCGYQLSGNGGSTSEIYGFANTLRWTWPAQNGDAYESSSPFTDPYVRYGALFAIPGSVNLLTQSFPGLGTGGFVYPAGFESPFGLIIAQCLQNYGMYVCDTNGGTTQASGAITWCAEVSPALAGNPYGTGYATGSVEECDAVLYATWGHHFAVNTSTTPSISSARSGDMSAASKWARDNDRIVALLQVITNNYPASVGGGGIGGGGTPRMPPAPPFNN
jgi:hypothetical protein